MHTFTVDISDFSSLNGEQVNNLILERELLDVGFHVQAVSFPLPESVEIHLASQPSAEDEVNILQVCASHKGGGFSPENQGAFDGSAVATGAAKAEAVFLSTGPMLEGSYMLIWYAEISLEHSDGPLQAPSSEVIALGHLAQGADGSAIVASHSTNSSSPSNMGGVLPLSFKNGEESNFSLTIEASAQPGMGGETVASHVAKITNAQLFIRKA